MGLSEDRLRPKINSIRSKEVHMGLSEDRLTPKINPI